MANSIIWKRWHDPLLTLNAEGELPTPYEPEDDEDEPDFHKSRESFGAYKPGYQDPSLKRQGQGWVGPCVFAPQGIIPLHEHNLPSKLFKFWIGHCNFDLDYDMVDRIEAVPGVETIDIFTRYRFRLGIGISFKDSEVRSAIDMAVQPPEPKKQITFEAGDKLAPMKRRLSRQFPFWAIFKMPQERLHVVGGESPAAVEEKSKTVSGHTEVIYSWKN